MAGSEVARASRGPVRGGDTGVRAIYFCIRYAHIEGDFAGGCRTGEEEKRGDVAVKLEEYRKWIKRNGNKEEMRAYEVVQDILSWHFLNLGEDYEVKLHPRQYSKDGRKIEFDLIIELVGNKNTITIGVEFKELDLSKVIKQAVVRRSYVDYMYIATKNTLIFHPELIFLLGYFGIGWIVWFEDTDFVKMIFSSKKRWLNISFDSAFIDLIIKETIRYILQEHLNMKVEKNLMTKTRSLFEFVEEKEVYA